MLKVLYCYPDFKSNSYEVANSIIEIKYVARLNKYGFDVDSFCISLNPPSQSLSWKQLDYLYKSHDPELLLLYQELRKKAKFFDVLINASGINLHPDFLQSLDIFKVFVCYDDPENSHNLSRPVAKYYDLCLVGNIAEVDKYYTWGAKKAVYRPIGFNAELFSDIADIESFISIKNRINPIVFVGDFSSKSRKKLLNFLLKEFPMGQYFGHGSPNGFISDKELLDLYRTSQIGVNMDLSSGPVNSRTFTIPANGALLLGNNPHYLNEVFNLGDEAVGYSDFLDLKKKLDYYMCDVQLQRSIALKGFWKTHSFYNEKAIMQGILNIIEREKMVYTKNTLKLNIKTYTLLDRIIAKIRYRSEFYLDLRPKHFYFLLRNIIVKISNAL
jgi:spore maturation protein CgeB